jgi:hypothetical protein
MRDSQRFNLFRFLFSTSGSFWWHWDLPFWLKALGRLGLGRLSLAGDGSPGALPRSRIGFGPLTSGGQAAPMTQPTITPDVHQALDVHVDFPAETALDLVAGLDDVAELIQLLLSESVHARLGIDAGLLEYLPRRFHSDPEDGR